MCAQARLALKGTAAESAALRPTARVHKTTTPAAKFAVRLAPVLDYFTCTQESRTSLTLKIVGKHVPYIHHRHFERAWCRTCARGRMRPFLLSPSLLPLHLI